MSYSAHVMYGITVGTMCGTTAGDCLRTPQLFSEGDYVPGIKLPDRHRNRLLLLLTNEGGSK